jgi:hypothetical protein
VRDCSRTQHPMLPAEHDAQAVVPRKALQAENRAMSR